MTATEADQFLAHYRELMKAWVKSLTGLGVESEPDLRRKLHDGMSTLAEIAIAFPDRARSAEMLMRSRSTASEVADL